MDLLIKLCFIVAVLKCTRGDKSQNQDSEGFDLSKVVKVLDENSITVVTYKDVYEQKYCAQTRREYFKYTTEGVTEDNDNSIVFRNLTAFELIGQMTIAPISDLGGFQVNFGASNYTDGIQFRFTTEELLCQQGKTIEEGKIKAKFCASVTQLKRLPSSVRGCITIGGAKLSAKDYDINTVNKFNTFKVLAIDMGCYEATKGNIEYSENKAYVLNKTLEIIVNQINQDVCGASQHLANIIVILTFALLSIKFSQY